MSPCVTIMFSIRRRICHAKIVNHLRRTLVPRRRRRQWRFVRESSCPASDPSLHVTPRSKPYGMCTVWTPSNRSKDDLSAFTVKTDVTGFTPVHVFTIFHHLVCFYPSRTVLRRPHITSTQHFRIVLCNRRRVRYVTSFVNVSLRLYLQFVYAKINSFDTLSDDDNGKANVFVSVSIKMKLTCTGEGEII